MIVITENAIDKIERFNEYVREHPAEVGSMFDQARGSDGLVEIANRLGFSITTEDVDAYVREKAARTVADDLDPLSPGVFCSFSVTTTYTYSTTTATIQTVTYVKVETILIVIVVVTVFVFIG